MSEKYESLKKSTLQVYHQNKDNSPLLNAIKYLGNKSGASINYCKGQVKDWLIEELKEQRDELLKENGELKTALSLLCEDVLLVACNEVNDKSTQIYHSFKNAKEISGKQD